MTFGKKTLFSLLLGLDLLADTLELTHVNFLGISTLLSFYTCILLPGYLISLILRIRKISFWENLLIIVGLSIAFLEFGGLLLNILLPLFGVNDPLAFQNLAFGFGLYVLLLFIVAWLRTKQLVVQIQLPRRTNVEKALYVLPVFFPLLAALGAIVLNNGGSNILTLILLGTIAAYSLLLVLFRDKIPADLFPYALLLIGMAMLFTTSLRSWYITGHDIETEFYVFQLTNTHHLWNMAFFQDAYNACLSITILPTILTNLLSIQDMFIYKVIFQILFATAPVLVFFILRNYTTPAFAFLSAFLFISFPTFFNDMAMLNRQEIGFIFFGLVLYMMLKRKQTRQYYTKPDTLSLADLSKLDTRSLSTLSPLSLAGLSKSDTLSLANDLSKLDTRSFSALSPLPFADDLSKSDTRSLSALSPLSLTDDLSKSDTRSLSALSPDLSLSMRRVLFVIFALGVIVSHYSTNFVLLALVAFVYISTFIISRSFTKRTFAWLFSKSHIRLKNTFPNIAFLSLPLISILFGMTYFWNTLYTQSSNHAVSVVSEVVNSLFVRSNIDNKSSDLSDSIFFAVKPDPKQALQDYINSIRESQEIGNSYSKSITDKNPSTPVSQEQLAPTPLGSVLSSFHIPVFNIQAELRLLAAYFMQIFVFIGLLAVFFLKNRGKEFELQYLLLCIGSLFLLVLITALPVLAVEYGVLRMFQQLLFIFSLPIVLGLSSLLFFVKEQKRIFITGIVVIMLFLNLTGFISHLTGDYYPQMTLDNAGLYYDTYYVHTSDVLAMVWLSKNDFNHDPVMADSSALSELLTYGGIKAFNANFPSLMPQNAYVYQEVSRNVVVAIADLTVLYSSDKPFLDQNKNLIYSNGQDNVYK